MISIDQEISKLLIRHGSKDSIDEDYFLIVNGSGQLPNKELMALKKSVDDFYRKQNFDITIIDINEFGIVTFAFSGTPDEVNNGIFRTFSLHEQPFVSENPVKMLVDRHIELKWARVIRGILTHCSRTQFRDIVKSAIKSSDIFTKMSALNGISFDEISPNDLKISIEDFYKFIAFQVVQYLGLQKKVEIYTKQEAIEFIASGKCFSPIFSAPFGIKQIENSAIKMINREIKNFNHAHVNHIVGHLTMFPANLDIVEVEIEGKDRRVFNTSFGYFDLKTEQYF